MTSLADPARTAAVEATGLFDAQTEPAFDRLARVARRTLGGTVSLVSLVGADRQVAKGRDGADVDECPARDGICRLTVERDAPLAIGDTAADPRVRDLPPVREGKVAAYLGVPLRDSAGVPVGSFCVCDETPRTWTDGDVALLSDLGEAASAEIAARAVLREQKDRFRALADTVPALLWATDATGRCTFLSKSWTEFTGQPEAVGLGFGWVETVHPDDRETARETFEAAATDRAPFAFDYRLRHRDGTYRWAIDAGTPRFDADGSFRGYVGAVTDVHDRSLAEAALRESESRYRVLFESLDVGFCILDIVYDDDGTAVDYRFVETNPAFMEQTGMVDPVGRKMREMVPDIEPFWIETYARVAETGAPVRFENEAVALGRSFDVYAVRVGGDESRRVALLFTDTTAQKAAEQALRESEARSRNLTEALPAIVYTSTTEGSLAYLNRRWFEYTGQAPDADPAEAIQAAIHPDDAPLIEGAWAEAHASGQPFEAELRLRQHDGAYRWFVTRVEPLADVAGTVAEWVGTSVDIHATKVAEAELEARVQERTAELARSNADLDQFAYVASHDLKAPLRAIDSLATWIEDDAGGVLPPASARHLTLLRGRVGRMEGLLDSLLTYSRVGREEAAPELIDTGALARDAVALVAPPAGVEVHAEGAFPTIRSARAPLELVVRNLISNAVKHHDRPDGHVAVSATVHGTWAEFAVADDGPGVAPAYRERVFEMFQTLRPRDEVEGSGMGLSIARKAVEARGGRLWLEPGAGRGATFRFTWPLTATP